jgi:hypothetical protein
LFLGIDRAQTRSEKDRGFLDWHGAADVVRIAAARTASFSKSIRAECAPEKPPSIGETMNSHATGIFWSEHSLNFARTQTTAIDTFRGHHVITQKQFPCSHPKTCS